MAPFVPLYAQGLGMTNRGIGLLLAVPGVGALLASLLASAWLIRFGTRQLILAAALVATVSLVAVWVWPSVIVFGIAMSLYWAVQPLVAIASQVVVVTRPPLDSADRVVGMHAFYVSLGMPFGPLLGSAVEHATGRLAWVFLLGAAVSAVASGLAVRAPVHRPAMAPPGMTLLGGLRKLPLLVKASLAAVLIAEFCYVAWATFFPIALKEVGRSPEAIGVLFTLHGVMLSVTRTTLARLVIRLGRLGVLAASLVCIGAGLWASAARAVPHMANASALLLGMGFGLIFPITIILVSAASDPAQVGRALSVRFSMMTVGQILGPFLTGFIAGYSLTGALASAAIVATAAALWVSALRRASGEAFLDTPKSAVLR